MTTDTTDLALFENCKVSNSSMYRFVALFVLYSLSCHCDPGTVKSQISELACTDPSP